jgi:hypothetical protein
MSKILRILFPLLIFFLAACGKQGTISLQENPAKAAKEFGLTWIDGTFCLGVEKPGYIPLSPGSKFFPEESGSVKVYLLSTFQVDANGQSVIQRFSKLYTTLDGKEIWVAFHSIPAQIQVSRKYHTYGFITATPGKYRADVLASDGSTIIKTLYFEVEGDEKKIVPENPEESPKITLTDALLASRVNNGVPVNPGTTFKTGPVYVWIETVATEIPTKAYFRWSKNTQAIDGRMAWIPDLISSMEIKGKKWRTYTYRNCMPGEWHMDILSSDGKTVLKSIRFTVTE